MEENLEGIQRPVYRNLRIIWQVQVIGFVSVSYTHLDVYKRQK